FLCSRSFHDGLAQLAHLRGIAGHLDPAFFHYGELLCGSTLAARDYGARVPHALAGRCREAGDESHHGLPHVRLHPARCFFFIGAADFAHHDDGFGFRIVIEHLQHVHVLENVHRVTAYTYARRLAQTHFHELADRFVGQGTRTRHDAHRAFLVD